ncbi:MAG TPA: SIR2 family protein [Thermoanaerobaculia bacterium]
MKIAAPKSLSEMIQDVVSSLANETRRRAVYTLVLGSGFSYPVIPTPSQMLKGDVALWNFCKQKKKQFGHRDAVLALDAAFPKEFAESERAMWQRIHRKAQASDGTRFLLDEYGLPDLSQPSSIGAVYQAVMAEALPNNRIRREYLRAVVRRSASKVNPAHLFLASIAESQSQECWPWTGEFCRTIFTTNFDPLLQRSFQLVNKLYFMTDRPDLLDAPDDDESDDAIHLVYTHGSVHRYDLRNTDIQIEKARAANSSKLSKYFEQRGVIVMGYSGWHDTTMDALLKCTSFESNLYWCDIHPSNERELESKLRPEAKELLEKHPSDAFYVQIPSADEAMIQLHRELQLGSVPRFMVSPIDTLHEQLGRVEIRTETDPSNLNETLPSVLKRTLTRLKAAREAFDSPDPLKKMTDAFIAYGANQYQTAIDLWTGVVTDPAVSDEERARAYLNRGFAWEALKEEEKEYSDYSEVIAIANARPEDRARAFLARGVWFAQRGETAKEVEDYTAAIEIENAPFEPRSFAQVYRGMTMHEQGDLDGARKDFDAVISRSDAAPEMRAEALLQRAYVARTQHRTDDEIADYTAAIERSAAFPDIWLAALMNRAAVYEDLARWPEALDDHRAVMTSSEAGDLDRARAAMHRGDILYLHMDAYPRALGEYTVALHLGIDDESRPAILRHVAWILGETGETREALKTYERILEDPLTDAETRADALLNIGWWRYKLDGNVSALVSDSMAARRLDPRRCEARMNLALGLLLSGDLANAQQAYAEFLALTADENDVRGALNDIREAVQQRGLVTGADDAIALIEGNLASRALMVNPSPTAPAAPPQI